MCCGGTSAGVEGILPVVVTSVEEGAMVLEVVGAQIIINDVKADIEDLEVMVAIRVDVVLVIVRYGVMKQDVQTQVKDTEL